MAESIKSDARRLIEGLPDDATWDDLMYEIYVRQAIEAGLEDSKAGRTIDVKEVRAKLGLFFSCSHQKRILPEID